MKKLYLTLVAAAALAAGPALAHHPSPAEPDIGDMQGMHDAAVESLLASGMGAGYLDNRDLPDNVAGGDLAGGSAMGGGAAAAGGPSAAMGGAGNGGRP